MALPFSTLDVFTDTPFEGNPLAVVTIPPGVDLTQAQKQAIAKEFNLSETVFVYDVDDPGATKERHINIFTPKDELPFAGHPTIGTAVFLQPHGVTTLVAKAGPINIEPATNGSVRAIIPHDVRLHEKRVPSLEPGSDPRLTVELAAAEAGSPLFSIVKGMTFALIELPSLELLAGVQVGAHELPASLLDEGWRDGWVTRRYYFVRTGSEKIGSRTVQKVRTRMVKLTTEDAATGSAACALASYLSLHELEDQSITFEITQGVEMGRKSNIFLDVEVGKDSNGSRKLETLHLGGKAVLVTNGSIIARP
ncbi:isomerase [Colletotrichum truncatum]|uniref:Isomerase n=1 Tax=Colletotrichum truncatum TaxID=5467 RepID=A0ACC3YLL9_COLTU|nr:isomerase [Colletotrichum truncatum]KAF6782604.1 isomerase [Colletotrichum truncatum]